MPLYEAVCLKCGKYHEYVKSAAEYLDTPECCGEKTSKRILTSPFGIVDIPAYQSPVTGKWINSRQQRKEDLKRTGSRGWEGLEQERKEAERQRAYDEAKADEKLDATVRTAWADLSPAKKAVLLKAA